MRHKSTLQNFLSSFALNLIASSVKSNFIDKLTCLDSIVSNGASESIASLILNHFLCIFLNCKTWFFILDYFLLYHCAHLSIIFLLQDVVPKYPPVCDVVWVDAEDPLFLLYTSGSTGKPKVFKL